MRTAQDKWLRKVARELDRTRLKRARDEVRKAREAKRAASKRARAVCARARSLFRRWVVRERLELKARIARMRLELRAETERRRTRVKACCSRDHAATVRAEHDQRIADLREQLERETRLQSDLRRRKLEHPPAGKARKERRAESDHEVEVNLSPDELIVFRAVREQIKPTDRMSRTEAFQHWTHENSAEVARILAADAEQAYQRAIRAEQQQRETMRRKESTAELAQRVSEQLKSIHAPARATPRDATVLLSRDGDLWQVLVEPPRSYGETITVEVPITRGKYPERAPIDRAVYELAQLGYAGRVQVTDANGYRTTLNVGSYRGPETLEWKRPARQRTAAAATPF